MEILKLLKIKNFLGTKSREVDFTLKENPLFIVGQNAGGKTTIMRAVYFALTGEDAFFGKNKTDGLINDHSDNMSIELDIANKGQIYKITIEKKKGKALTISILENGKSLLASKLTTEAKNTLVKLFGNPTAILSTYFIFGDNKNDFVDNTPMQRLNIITRVSDAFQKYEKISESAKGFIKKLEVDKNQKIGQLEFAQNNVKELEGKIKLFNENEINKIINENKVKKEELLKVEKIKGDIINIDKELSLLNNINIEDIIKKIKDNKTIIKENKIIEKDLIDLKNQLNIFEKQFSELKIKHTKEEGRLLNITNEIKTNNSFIKTLKNDIISKYKLSLEEAHIKIEKGKIAIEEKLELGTKLKTDIDIIKSDISKLDKEILKQEEEKVKTNELFEHNTNCPLCHNILNADSLENYHKFISETIIKLKEDKLKKENLIKNKEIEKEKILKQWKEFSGIVKDIELYIKEKEIAIENKKIEDKLITLEKKQKEIQKELDISLKNIEKDNKIVLDFTKQIETKNKLLKPTLSDEEINNYEKILDTNKKATLLKEQKELLQSNIKEEYSEFSLENIQNTLKDIENLIYVTNAKLNTFKDDVKRLETESKKEIDIKNIIKELNIDIEQYEDISKLYGKDGIQKKQIQLLLSQIEIETNGLIKNFFDNLSVKFDYGKRGIDLKILRRVMLNNGGYEEKEDVLGNFSDAQQEVLKVLLKISFSKVVQNLNNTPLNILFLNETFNTLSKDKESLLVDTLNYYARDYHICFITHNKELLGNFGGNNIYDINKE